MKVYLIRHAEQDETQCLTERGYRQAKKLGGYLRGKGIDVVFSSDRMRSRETARVAAQIMGVEHRVLPDLEEVGEVRLSETQKDAEERVYNGVAAAIGDRSVDSTVAFVLHSNLIRHFLARIGYPQYLPEELSLSHTGVVTLDYDPEAQKFDLLEYDITTHLS